MNQAASQDASRQGSSLPALVMTLLVAAAAIYSFSPRPAPPFAPTEIHPDGILVNGLAQNGVRILAAGEQGRILVADSPAGPWHEAKVQPQRGSTLTQIKYVGKDTAIAVGHDGWILRSTDNGESWNEVAFTEPTPEAPPAAPADAGGPPPMMDLSGGAPPANPLMGIAGPYEGRIFVFGGFGEFRVSGDEGKTWQPITDPAVADHHLNAMTRAADGALVLVGERGLMARSSDNGVSWALLPPVYNGSFFGALTTPANTLIAFGMRGNVFYSNDNGQSWQKGEVPEALSLFAGAIEKDGAVILAGEADSVLRSTDGGAHFTLVAQGKRERLTAVLPSTGQGWLAGGEGGLVTIQATARGAAK